MGQGLEGSVGQGENVLLSGGTAISYDDGALRDSCSAGPMCGDGCLLLRLAARGETEKQKHIP
jgi:hypothetical protein